MRLKKVKLAGFKSFVDPTSVNFPHQMTCVVGPNGCGKSNIIDAVRWVLGESSAKNLRGEDMTDVIFNGSTNRKAIGQASVELVFENTEGRIAGSLADRSEISIKRLVTQQRKSSYFLNGEKCRRRDITDIFLGTGMGPRSYSIIEQGMISRLIESKPQELRVFLEEAAGISRYKERRKETENRIKHTRENLVRLNDIKSEVSKILEKLKKQAESAKRYTELKAEERKFKNELSSIRHGIHSEKAKELKLQISTKEIELEHFKTNKTHSDRILIDFKSQSYELTTAQEEKQKEFYRLSAHISKIEEQIKNLKQNKNKLTTDIQSSNEKLNKLTTTYDEQNKEIKSLTLQLEEMSPDLIRANESLDNANKLLKEVNKAYNTTQQNWQKLVTASSELESKISEKKSKIEIESRIRDQKNIRLQQISFEKNEITRLILSEDLDTLKAENDELVINEIELTTRLQEAHTSLNILKHEAENNSDKLKINNDKEAKLAGIKTSIEYLQNFKHDNENEAEEYLTENKINHKTILEQLTVEKEWRLALENICALFKSPILVDKFPSNPPNFLNIFVKNNTHKTVGSLASVIIKGDYPDFFNNILLDIPTNNDNNSFIKINREGHLTTKNWQITNVNDPTSGYFERSEELKKANIEISALTKENIELAKSISDSKKTIEEKEKIILELHQDLNKLGNNLTRIKTKISMLESQIVQAKEKLQSLNNEEITIKEDIETSLYCTEDLVTDLIDIEELSATSKSDLPKTEDQKRRLEEQLDTLREKQESSLQLAHKLTLKKQNALTKKDAYTNNIISTKDNLDQEQNSTLIKKDELKGLELPIEDLQFDIQDALAGSSDLEEILNTYKIDIDNINTKISNEEKGLSSFKIKEDEIKNITDDLRLQAEKELIHADTFIQQLNEANTTLNNVLANIPNEHCEKDWLLELESLSKQISRIGPVNLTAISEYDAQKSRNEYLEKQYNDLTGALDTLNGAIATIDKETKVKFSETFESVNEGLQDLFPKVFGGGSAYLKLTGDDLLEAGVTIMARPPGKKNSTIHLLSGGEKALTALSLVFSIFKLNPAPFCMLDEVDAPLDDVNVGRFCRLVDSMSSTVQFIYISHNKVAMEMAHQLSGVTMQEAGVSRLVAVDVDEASRLASL